MKTLTPRAATLNLINAVESSGVKLTLDGLGRIQSWMAKRVAYLADRDGPTKHRVLCRRIRREFRQTIVELSRDNELDADGVGELQVLLFSGTKYCDPVPAGDDPGPIDPD